MTVVLRGQNQDYALGARNPSELRGVKPPIGQRRVFRQGVGALPPERRSLAERLAHVFCHCWLVSHWRLDLGPSEAEAEPPEFVNWKEGDMFASEHEMKLHSFDEMVCTLGFFAFFQAA